MKHIAIIAPNLHRAKIFFGLAKFYGFNPLSKKAYKGEYIAKVIQWEDDLDGIEWHGYIEFPNSENRDRYNLKSLS